MRISLVLQSFFLALDGTLASTIKFRPAGCIFPLAPMDNHQCVEGTSDGLIIYTTILGAKFPLGVNFSIRRHVRRATIYIDSTIIRTYSEGPADKKNKERLLRNRWRPPFHGSVET